MSRKVERFNSNADIQKQGWMRGAVKAGAKAFRDEQSGVSDAQFRENIRRKVARETRIMFGEQEPSA